ncbi:histidinol-phosphatase [bacterium]|nr:histidinol-phosphatase [bacterium]
MALKEFIQFAQLLADESANVIKRYFRTPVAVDQKPDETPVTIADRQAEEVMWTLIAKEFPDHGVIGEEMGEEQSDAKYRWVLDPIDGTLTFICGGLTFGTLIALLEDGQPILGVINQPILGEMLVGTGTETRLNGEIVRARDCPRISDASMLTSDPYLIEQHQKISRFNELRKQVKVYRGFGDCYGYFLLACGLVDIMVDPIMNIWDSMALIPIVRGAGGTITDYYGGDPTEGTSIVATGGEIHQEVIGILNGGKV